MNVREFAVLMMVCLFWGLHFTVLRDAMTYADPFFYAALRMSLVTLLLLPFLRWHKGQMRAVLIGGLGFGALNYAFMFPALELTTASAGAVAIELYMPFSILLSVFFLKERIGLWRSFAIGLAFLGVVIIGLAAPDETAGPYFTLGVAMVVAAALSEACGAIAVKSVRGIGPLQLLVWFGVVGSAVLWPLSFVFEHDQLAVFAPETRWAFMGALGYSTVLASILAHASYYWLLQRLPIHLITPSGLMTTVIGVLGGVLILGETLSVQLFVGTIVTLTGIALILWRNRLDPKQAKGAPRPE